MELARYRASRGALSKPADPRAVALELVERGDYDEARAVGSDLGDDRLQSLVRVDMEMRETAEQISRDTEGAHHAYQRLAARKLELVQQLGPGPAEGAGGREEEADASVEMLVGGVQSQAEGLTEKWEALLAGCPPARQANGIAASHAVDAAATSLTEEHGRARRVLQRRRDAVAFSLGAIEACELDHAISALDDIVAMQCDKCVAGSTRLLHALKNEWDGRPQRPRACCGTRPCRNHALPRWFLCAGARAGVLERPGSAASRLHSFIHIRRSLAESLPTCPSWSRLPRVLRRSPRGACRP